MTNLNYGVIGVGYLGRFHAQKYLNLAQAKLRGVYDISAEQAESVAHELGVQAYLSLDSLLADVDAVSIAASTSVHYALAKRCLSQGIHVLLEKPMTLDLLEAQDLIKLAREQQCILQIGHLERFNPAYQSFLPHLTQPSWIQMNRRAPFKQRGTDANVILDLMIHDLDILLSLVKSPITEIKASGLSLMTKGLDIVSVALSFANGCVANLHASRVDHGLERQTRIYQGKDCYLLNFQEQSLTRYHHLADKLVQETISTEKQDALALQIQAFVASVQDEKPVLVDGQAGHQALELALRIQDLIPLTQQEVLVV